MKLSPLDIKKQEFTRALRGYDADEVQAFLSMLSGQWEEVLAEQRRADDRLRELKSKLEHYERVEVALQEALQTARENSRQALENAKQEALLIVKKAVGEAEDLTRGAAQQRDQLLQEIDDLLGRREEIVVRLRSFLLSEVEILKHFETREARSAGLHGYDQDSLSAPGVVLLTSSAPLVFEEDAHGRLPELDTPEKEPVPTAKKEHSPEPSQSSTDAPAASFAAEAGEAEEEVVSQESKVVAQPAEETAAVEAEAVVPVAAVEEETAKTSMPPEEADRPAFVVQPGEIEVEFTEGAFGDPSNFESEDDLSFRFFEPNEPESESAYAQDEVLTDGAPPGTGKDKGLGRVDDRPPADDTWIVRPVPAPGKTSEPAGEQSLTASQEEIEKIRRILNDLD